LYGRFNEETKLDKSILTYVSIKSVDLLAFFEPGAMTSHGLRQCKEGSLSNRMVRHVNYGGVQCDLKEVEDCDVTSGARPAEVRQRQTYTPAKSDTNEFGLKKCQALKQSATYVLITILQSDVFQV
jgi:hypothetical protein